MTTYGNCCYAECPNSYSTDSDDVFFKFPVEPGRRKKWIDNCGNPELTLLADRQLRGKRVCSRHFLAASFVNPKEKDALTDKAIPALYKPNETTKSGSQATTVVVGIESDEEESVKTPDTGKRGRGRPRTKGVLPSSSVKKEPEEVELDDGDVEYAPEEESPPKPKPTPRHTTSTATPKTGSATPVNGTGTGKKAGPGRPPRRSLAQVIDEAIEAEKVAKAAAEKAAAAKAAKTKTEETPTPGPSGSRTTRRGQGVKGVVEKEKESGEIKTAKDVPPTPIDSLKTKMGLRKSLVARVQEDGKDKRAMRLRAAKSESEEEHPPKKAKSPAPVPTGMISRSKSQSPSKSQLTFTAAEVKSASLKKGKGDSGEESTSDKEWVEPSAKDKSYVGTLKKDTRIFEKFLAELKSVCVLPDQWTLSGILWDPGHKMKMITALEMEVASLGEIRLKRCVQIFEDMSIKILVDDMTMTTHFETTKVTGHMDVVQLITKVAMAKVCPGIKTFESLDSTYLPLAVNRTRTWYSADCPVIVDHSVVGPLCSSCSRLRSSIQRRKIKEKMDLERKQSKIVGKGTSKIGKALYTLLTGLMTESPNVVKKPFVPPPPVPQTIGTTWVNRAGQETVGSSQEGAHASGADKKNGISSGTPKATPMRKIKPKITQGGGEETLKQAKARGGGARGGRGKASTSASTPSGSNNLTQGDGQGDGVVEMLEQYVTIEGDHGNLILQQGSGEFTLAEGQEYELIGEVDAYEPMQVMDPENSHQTIEIIEVDDHTMAQLTGHSVNDMFFQGSENIQVTEIDPNDPNMGQLLKVIDPSQGFTFQ